MGLKYNIIDNEDTLACAARNGIPREDLVERPCVNCGEPALLTQVQFAAYERDVERVLGDALGAVAGLLGDSTGRRTNRASALGRDGYEPGVINAFRAPKPPFCLGQGRAVSP